jgi:hypothetical protein
MLGPNRSRSISRACVLALAACGGGDVAPPAHAAPAPDAIEIAVPVDRLANFELVEERSLEVADRLLSLSDQLRRSNSLDVTRTTHADVHVVVEVRRDDRPTPAAAPTSVKMARPRAVISDDVGRRRSTNHLPERRSTRAQAHAARGAGRPPAGSQVVWMQSLMRPQGRRPSSRSALFAFQRADSTRSHGPSGFASRARKPVRFTIGADLERSPSSATLVLSSARDLQRIILGPVDGR